MPRLRLASSITGLWPDNRVGQADQTTVTAHGMICTRHLSARAIAAMKRNASMQGRRGSSACARTLLLPKACARILPPTAARRINIESFSSTLPVCPCTHRIRSISLLRGLSGRVSPLASLPPTPRSLIPRASCSSSLPPLGAPFPQSARLRWPGNLRLCGLLDLIQDLTDGPSP